MRNHTQLIALRRNGLKPAGFVWVYTEACPRGMSDAARWYRDDNVFIEPEDNVARLDLRFLVDCDVMIDGRDAERVREVFDAAVRHKARRVIANCGRVVNGTGRLDFVLDSAEVLTWHA